MAERVVVEQPEDHIQQMEEDLAARQQAEIEADLQARKAAMKVRMVDPDNGRSIEEYKAMQERLGKMDEHDANDSDQIPQMPLTASEVKEEHRQELSPVGILLAKYDASRIVDVPGHGHQMRDRTRYESLRRRHGDLALEVDALADAIHYVSEDEAEEAGMPAVGGDGKGHPKVGMGQLVNLHNLAEALEDRDSVNTIRREIAHRLGLDEAIPSEQHRQVNLIIDRFERSKKTPASPVTPEAEPEEDEPQANNAPEGTEDNGSANAENSGENDADGAGEGQSGDDDPQENIPPYGTPPEEGQSGQDDGDDIDDHPVNPETPQAGNGTETDEPAAETGPLSERGQRQARIGAWLRRPVDALLRGHSGNTPPPAAVAPAPNPTQFNRNHTSSRTEYWDAANRNYTTHQPINRPLSQGAIIRATRAQERAVQAANGNPAPEQVQPAAERPQPEETITRRRLQGIRQGLGRLATRPGRGGTAATNQGQTETTILPAVSENDRNNGSAPLTEGDVQRVLEMLGANDNASPDADVTSGNNGNLRGPGRVRR